LIEKTSYSGFSQFPTYRISPRLLILYTDSPLLAEMLNVNIRTKKLSKLIPQNPAQAERARYKQMKSQETGLSKLPIA